MPPYSEPAPARGIISSMSTKAFTAEKRPQGSLVWTANPENGWVLVEVLTQDNTLLSVKNKATGATEMIDLVSQEKPNMFSAVVCLLSRCRGFVRPYRDDVGAHIVAVCLDTVTQYHSWLAGRPAYRQQYVQDKAPVLAQVTSPLEICMQLPGTLLVNSLGRRTVACFLCREG